MEEIKHLFATQPFTIAFVLGVYLASAFLYKRTKLPFLHPVLLSIAVIIGTLKLFNVEYQTFKDNS